MYKYGTWQLIFPLSDREPDRGDGPLQRDQHHLWLWPLFTGRVHSPQTTELLGGDGHVTGSRKLALGNRRVDGDGGGRLPNRVPSFKEGASIHICRSCLTGLTELLNNYHTNRNTRTNTSTHGDTPPSGDAVEETEGGSCGRGSGRGAE